MSSRNQSLDVLRGIAVLMVIVYHNYMISEPPLLQFLARGVDLFFVLSGFLVSGLLFSEYKARGTINCWRFWLRRGFKIYPAFYAFIALTAVLIFRGHVPTALLWNELFFVQNYRAHFWPHTWSLAVEEHFYLVLPILLLVIIKLQPRYSRPFRVLPIISIALAIECTVFRGLVASAGAGRDEFLFPTHLRLDALFAGVTLAYFYHFDRSSFQEARKLWVLMVGVLIFMACIPVPYMPQLTFAYAGFTFILAWTVNQSATTFRHFWALAWVGRYSYSIYLWHLVAFALVQRLFPRYASLTAYLIASILVGVILAKLIEIPFLRLREKLVPSTNSVQASSTAVPQARLLSSPS
jgi:peptidoglycan/LPS O-acetylase OafA/YrhL